MTEISRTSLLQLDFDRPDIIEYDIEELKQAVFGLPFMAYCGLSCSGDGFYALALIAEPYRLPEYAEHIFQVLLEYGIRADQSKGKKVENLRYVSYDDNMLYRERPDPLQVANFRSKQSPKLTLASSYNRNYREAENKLVNALLTDIKKSSIGNRWATVQRVAYTLGGLGNPQILDLIKIEIKANPQFNGLNSKYLKCAEDCFIAGATKPLSFHGDS